jgi:DNA polymerase V
LIVAHQSTRPKSMNNTGHAIKQIISKNNSTYLEDNPPKGTYRLSTISQSLAAQLRPTLSYKHLQKGYFLIKAHCSRPIPFYVTRVAAGMPFNGEDYDYIEHIDLNEHLIGNAKRIFCIRVEGDSMVGAGICDNDILFIDRSVEPTDGKIVIASLNSELTVKRLKWVDNQIILMPENPLYSPLFVTKDIELKIWGVVVHVVHSLLTEEKSKCKEPV